jgi:hypothetical protein
MQWAFDTPPVQLLATRKFKTGAGGVEPGGTSFHVRFSFHTHTHTQRLPGAASKWHRKQADGDQHIQLARSARSFVPILGGNSKLQARAPPPPPGNHLPRARSRAFASTSALTQSAREWRGEPAARRCPDELR